MLSCIKVTEGPDDILIACCGIHNKNSHSREAPHDGNIFLKFSCMCNLILLTASELPPESESLSEYSDLLLSAFESDGDFAASAIQLLGHFLAPGRIPPPMVTTEDDTEDSEAEMIKEYTAMLREPGSKNTASGHGKCSII